MEEKLLVEHLLEGMRGVESRDAALHAKQMFGGYGICLDGRMFALVADGELYLKADAENAAGFDARNLQAFTYESSRGPATMSYRLAPPGIRRSPGMPPPLGPRRRRRLGAIRHTQARVALVCFAPVQLIRAVPGV